MTERRVTESIVTNFGQEENKEKLCDAWQNLFAELNELGTIREKPANSFVPTANIRHDKEDPEFEYYLRINPALLTAEGNIEIIVLDVTFMGEPSQQWVAKANWHEGKPKLIALDPSIISEEGEGFGAEKIAIFATATVKKYQYAFLMAREDPTALLSAPEGYSPKIN